MSIVSEATRRNMRSTARHQRKWTDWKVAYDRMTVKMRAPGKRVNRG